MLFTISSKVGHLRSVHIDNNMIKPLSAGNCKEVFRKWRIVWFEQGSIWPLRCEPKSSGWSFWTRLCSPAAADGLRGSSSLPFLLLPAWNPSVRARGAEAVRPPASGKGQENPRNTDPEQVSLQSQQQRPKHSEYFFKLTLGRFSLTCRWTHS